MSVYDASALLAVLLDEPGRSKVALEMEGDSNIVSCVNVAETIGTLMRKAKLAFEDAVAAVRELDLHWWEPTDTEALRAAELSTIKDLALGDRFCIALGELRHEPLVTADRTWANLMIAAPVHLIR